MSDLATLQALAEAVLASGIPCSPAELHGAVCGFAVCAPDPFPMYELADALDPAIDGDDEALHAFVWATVDVLEATDFAFAPLLPEDETLSPEARLDALARWCNRFLATFGSALAMTPEGSDPEFASPGLPDDVQEIVDDLAAIAEADSDSVVDLAEDDVDAELMQLEEFVKVGVLLIRSAMTEDNRVDDGAHYED